MIGFLLAQNDGDGGQCHPRYPSQACDPEGLDGDSTHYGVEVHSLTNYFGGGGKYLFGEILLEALETSGSAPNIYDFRQKVLDITADMFGIYSTPWSQVENAFRATGFYEEKTRYDNQGLIIGNAADTPVALGIPVNGVMRVYWRTSASTVSTRMFWPAAHLWGVSATVPAVSTDVAPAVAFYSSRIHLVYKQLGSSTIMHTSADYYGNGWTTPVAVGSSCSLTVESNLSPSLAVFNGKLYLAYSYLASGYMRFTTYDGTSWATCPSMTGQRSSDHPAIAATKNGLLWFVYKDMSSQDVRYFSVDGAGVIGSVQGVPFQETFQTQGEPPALVQTDRAPAALAWMDRLYVAYYSPSNNAVRVVSCGGACDDVHRGMLGGQLIGFPDFDWTYVTELPAWTSRTPSLAESPTEGYLFVFLRSLTNSNIWMTHKGSNY